MHIIAHRGARAFAPENTIEALMKASDLGSTAVEVDVQMSADGIPIVVHDDTFVRCSDVERYFPDRRSSPVCKFTLAEIQRLDAGSWFAREITKPRSNRQAYLKSLTRAEQRLLISEAELTHYASGLVKVPTLVDCITTCQKLGMDLYIELKMVPRFYDGLTERVVEAVVQAGTQMTTIISSFDHQQLAIVRDTCPAIRTAVLTSDRLFDPVTYLKCLGAASYSPGCNDDYDSIGLDSVSGTPDHKTIQELRQAGFDVNVWTENDQSRLQKLLMAGVTGIFTDYPNRLRDIIAHAETF